MGSQELCRRELRSAIATLQSRCLYSASKWAAELLVSLDPTGPSSSLLSARSASASASAARIRGRRRSGSASSIVTTPIAGISYVATPVAVDVLDDGDADVCLLAKSYFDCREYRRAAHVLRDRKGKKALFLRCYALYLAGEKRKEEEMIETERSLGKTVALNNELVYLERVLSMLHRNGDIDSFCLYLYGLILRDRGCEKLSISMLVESVNTYPWNWSAWSELQSLCTTIDILNSLNLKNHWMKDFFLARAHQELNMHEEALERYECLLAVFRFSDYIRTQIATALYGLREVDEAEVIFDEVLRTDPHRVECMDIFSNVLYMKESSSALSFLAHKVVLTDKYRPESCCVIANYYSLKGQHEKAVMYFNRALKLNRKYLAAWTLMGHEYVELKNIPAAVDAYRRAVDVNPRDYRAWYGLGQTYEMLGMQLYALYYFRRSSYLHPRDSRVWIAMAHCYESAPLQMHEDAIKCYMSADRSNDMEGIAVQRLAKIHDLLGHSELAAYYYKNDLQRMDAEGRHGINMVDALIFLAKHCQDQERFEEANIYCSRLLDYSGPDKETAMGFMKGLKMAVPDSVPMSIEQSGPSR